VANSSFRDPLKVAAACLLLSGP